MRKSPRSPPVPKPSPPVQPRFVRRPGRKGGFERWIPPRGWPLPHGDIVFVPLGKNQRDYPCGHRSSVRVGFRFYGELVILSDDFPGAQALCGSCQLMHFERFVTRCALCGRYIFPRQAVALYRDDPEVFGDRPWKKIVDDGAVVGCMRKDCCPSPQFFVGRWTGESVDASTPSKAPPIQENGPRTAWNSRRRRVMDE